MTENVPRNTANVVQRMSMKQHQALKPESTCGKRSKAGRLAPRIQNGKFRATHQSRIATTSCRTAVQFFCSTCAPSLFPYRDRVNFS
jgi:hypothetical protein